MALVPLDKEFERVGRNAWRGVETFECPYGEASGHWTTLWNSNPAGFSGQYAPKATRVVLHKNRPVPKSTTSPGKATLVRYSETLTWMERLRRDPEKGVLMMLAVQQTHPIDYDLDGLCINGTDFDDYYGRTRYRILEGPRSQHDDLAVMRIRIVTEDATLAPTWAGNKNKVNSTQMNYFGDLGDPGKALLLPPQAEPDEVEEGLYVVDLDFLCYPTPWNDSTIGQEMRLRTVEIDEYPLGTQNNYKARVWHNQSAYSQNTARLYEEADLSAACDYLTWYMA